LSPALCKGERESEGRKSNSTTVMATVYTFALYDWLGERIQG
jgi:hypothetical protein